MSADIFTQHAASFKAINLYHFLGKFSRSQTDDIFLIFKKK